MKNSVKLLLVMVIVSVSVLIYGKIWRDGQIEQTAVLAKVYIENQEKAEKQEALKLRDSYSDLYKLFIDKKLTRIKLIGDSITAGEGLESYHIPTDSRIIYTNKKDRFRESTFTTPSWANHFRTYTAKPDFGEIDFINAGISGKSASWANKNRKFLLDKNEDLVFVMLGTNDRKRGTLKNYKKAVENFLDYVDENSKHMVVMSPPPSLTDNQFPFGTKDINNVLKKLCAKKGYVFISHYDGMNAYAEKHQLKMNELMQSDGALPLELGYKVMWDTISNELGLINPS